MSRRLFFNIGWINTALPGYEGENLYLIHEPDGDCVIVENGKIEWIGFFKDAPLTDETERIDVQGCGLTAGLIDFHTHPVFAATREAEFELRTKGASYAEIAAAGGGILNSTKNVAISDEKALVKFSENFINTALAHGSTTMEAKSGYGLSFEGELKLLRAIKALNEKLPVDLIPTFLGAHEYPLEYRDNHEAYIDLLINELMPAVVEENLAEACDIFCETGVFSLDETRRILSAAKEIGLKIKVHADQLTPLGGTKLAAELGALSADHIEFIDEEGIDALAASGTVAGLLPVAAHFLRMKEDPPVRDMINRGVICALATDFNPGSAMCENMQMAIHLSVIRFRISPEEALWMATAGSAKALGLEDRGYIAPGYKADFVFWNSTNLKMLPYHFGINQAKIVVKNGEIVALEGKTLG